MPRIKPYEQNALDSCLTCCLLLISRHYKKRARVTKKTELRVLNAGLKFDSKNYDIGQLHETARRYNIDFDYFVENLETFHYTRKLPFSKRIVIHNKKIDMEFIREKLGSGPVIIPLDPYGLFDEGHYAHYVLLAGKKGKFFAVVDPWTGEEKQVEQKAVFRAIRAMKKLKFAPVLIAKRSRNLK